jgi:hypothetical protein
LTCSAGADRPLTIVIARVLIYLVGLLCFFGAQMFFIGSSPRWSAGRSSAGRRACGRKNAVQVTH